LLVYVFFSFSQWSQSLPNDYGLQDGWRVRPKRWSCVRHLPWTPSWPHTPGDLELWENPAWKVLARPTADSWRQYVDTLRSACLFPLVVAWNHCQYVPWVVTTCLLAEECLPVHYYCFIIYYNKTEEEKNIKTNKLSDLIRLVWKWCLWKLCKCYFGIKDC